MQTYVKGHRADVGHVYMSHVLNISTLYLNGKEVFQYDVATGQCQVMVLPSDIVVFVVYSPIDRRYLMPGTYHLDPGDLRLGADINFYTAQQGFEIKPIPLDEAGPAISLELVP